MYNKKNKQQKQQN